MTGVWHQGQIPGSAPPPRAFAVFPPAVSVFSCDDEGVFIPRILFRRAESPLIVHKVCGVFGLDHGTTAG